MRRTSPEAGQRLATWQRDTWARVADDMLLAVRPYASSTRARIDLPGAPGGYGSDVDGLEGFARTFLLAAFRLAGEHGKDLHGLAEWYAEGLAAGTDPGSPERWVRLDEHPQAKVEAASLALALDLTRPWLWDRLDPTVQEQIVAYLSPAVGDATYPRINWIWFRLVVQTFLRSVGGPWSSPDVEEDLATHDSFSRADGWLADGSERAYDHYAGWALHLYPTLWARMAGAADLAAGRRERDLAMLDRFLLDAVRLVGGDGSPLIQGRSLAYRFAAAAPFWIGAMAEVPSLSPGLLRSAAAAVVGHFADRGAPDGRGLLTLGWHAEWPQLAQAYSGPGSPYWAVKGMLGLSLPPEHPVWTAPAEPLPVERADFVFTVQAPGWVVAGTRDDGVVRVVNHGTDHAVEGAEVGDSPLYARLGYSTATCPLLDVDSWVAPLDQSVVLVDEQHRASHRAGMRTELLRLDGAGEAAVGVAASTARAHWLEPDPTQHHHGSGYTGVAIPAGDLRVVSLVRGPWELRLVRIDGPTDATGLRIGGWPAAGADPGRTAGPSEASVTGLHESSRIVLVRGEGETGTSTRTGASPLGETAAVPWLRFPAEAGRWVAVLLELARGPRPDLAAPHLDLADAADAVTCRVTWPDGVTTAHEIPIVSPTAARQPSVHSRAQQGPDHKENP